MTTEEILAELKSKRMLHQPCSQCMELLRQAAAEIEFLQSIIATHLHQRKCHDCGNVAWHADMVLPYCVCLKCKSYDTRMVK